MEFIGKWHVKKAMYFTEDGIKHLTKDEIIAIEGEDADLQMFSPIIQFCADGAIKTLVSVPAEELEEAKGAGMEIDADGFAVVEESQWKKDGDQVIMDQGGEIVPIEFTEEGLLKYAMGMMLLEKI